jgi:redox-sensitive bicupin YhaK (pirin superfamily)
MIYIRKSNDRGQNQISWLKTFHTFSFADYHDPAFMSFGSLRVINEDIIQPAKGFGRHPHNDMEIITYVIEGSLEHKDSMGTGSIIKPGEIQIMSAGTGVAHSEANPSSAEPLHLLQIWIIPERTGLTPSYAQITFSKEKNKFILIGAREKTQDAVLINQDVNLYTAVLEAGKSLEHSFKKDRQGWLQLIKGQIKLNAESMAAGDGAAIVDVDTINITSDADAEFLLFDLKF